MMVNFEKLGEIAFLVYLGENVVFDYNIIVNEFNYSMFVSNTFDA